MTDPQIAELLAKNVMGWELQTNYNLINKNIYWHDKGEPIMPRDKWHPKTDIAQAFMLEEKMIDKGFSFRLYEDKETVLAVFVFNRYEWGSKQFKKFKARAITMAVYEAVKNES